MTLAEPSRTPLHVLATCALAALLVSSCANRGQPRTAGEAVSESRAQQAGADDAFGWHCTNEFGDPIYQSPSDRRLYGDACQGRPVHRVYRVPEARPAPENAATPIPEVPSPAPVQIPPTPVPLPPGVGRILN